MGSQLNLGACGITFSGASTFGRAYGDNYGISFGYTAGRERGFAGGRAFGNARGHGRFQRDDVEIKSVFYECY